MTQACIFDLDGVLVDTVGLHFESWSKLAKSLGHELPFELKDKFRGASRLKSLGYILDDLSITASEKDKIKFCHLKNKWYQQSLENINETIILDGAKDLLVELSNSNIKIALASASGNAKLIVQKLNLDYLFDALVDANDVKKTKPDPEVFLTAASQLNCKPANCIVFEDSPLGITAAIKGGFKSIGIGNEINKSTVDLHVSELSELNLKGILFHFDN